MCLLSFKRYRYLLLRLLPLCSLNASSARSVLLLTRIAGVQCQLLHGVLDFNPDGWKPVHIIAFHSTGLNIEAEVPTGINLKNVIFLLDSQKLYGYLIKSSGANRE